MEHFCKSLKEIEQYTYGVLQHQLNKHIIWREGEKENHDASECCHICCDEITGVDDKQGCKVSDHCHVTDMYRGAAHKTVSCQ